MYGSQDVEKRHQVRGHLKVYDGVKTNMVCDIRMTDVGVFAIRRLLNSVTPID